MSSKFERAVQLAKSSILRAPVPQIKKMRKVAALNEMLKAFSITADDVVVNPPNSKPKKRGNV